MERSELAPDEGLEREVFGSSMKFTPHSHTGPVFLNKVHPKPTESTKQHNSDPKPLALWICLGWTLWLILLNVAPNDTVNGVMNTNKLE
ncbi:hypothetical protein PR003_g17226 [Phytophthora rubi]|uniref:Uncharacterized protein n=1 Tax=Phytophthora rubi TaxID=129364 RepID=A0A6A4EHI4_9STRA|nr:hypothetical protein PR002_g17104 [Phytophthora rubi]KAE9034064.1 hypothetical protein PR001_g9889 [Phytophthora rubi]KAE9322462.1 hypothetical protein PR003_g17226 [Phytophthora rubi]